MFLETCMHIFCPGLLNNLFAPLVQALNNILTQAQNNVQMGKLVSQSIFYYYFFLKK